MAPPEIPAPFSWSRASAGRVATLGVVEEGVPANLARLADIEAELADMDAALARLDDGSYWTCEVCGEPIDDELLASRPLARWCRQHQPPHPSLPAD